MIPQNIITELFLYFAKFPLRDGIYPLFNTGESSVPGYPELRDAIQKLPVHSLTNIENYVFGANFEAITARINNIPTGSNFLFVDFGEIDCDTDARNRHTDSARLAISVAYRIKSFSVDLIEQSLVFGHTLIDLVTIRNRMILDQQNHTWLKDISDSHSMVPFIAEKISSIGWTLEFNRQGYDSFNVRNI